MTRDEEPGCCRVIIPKGKGRQGFGRTSCDAMDLDTAYHDIGSQLVGLGQKVNM